MPTTVSATSIRSLDATLAARLIRAHPDRAAGVLERIGVDHRLHLLSTIDVRDAAAVVRRMSPLAAATVLERLPLDRTGQILDGVALDVSARLARGLNDDRRAQAIDHLDGARKRALLVLLRFPVDSAGALMDAAVLALAEDLTAGEAIKQIRQTPRNIHYNVYVVDRRQVLVGALNLRELFLARPRVPLSDLMRSNPWQLDAHAPRSAVVAHPGWKAVHTLPVVDRDGTYLGAVRYSTLRALEEELFGRKRADADARDALGELFAAGAAGLLEALTATRPQTGGR